jgi:ubiquinone/menaquinone biosynthesis C-methylase UbiE
MQALREMKRVLKPKGLLVLTVWRFHRLKELVSLLEYTIFKIIGKTKLDLKDVFVPWGEKTERYYHYFFQEELEYLLIKAGFKIIKSGVAKNKRGNRQNIYMVAEKPL